MKIRRFLMEDWLASYKDTCRYNLGESGMPDITVGELLARCGKSPESLSEIVLKDHDTRGTESLRNVIAATYGKHIGAEHITVTTGTSEALFILFNLLLEKRKSVIVPEPAFQALVDVPAALGAEKRTYHLTDSNGFNPDPDEVCSLIDDNTGMVVLNTPHNPSGRILFHDSAQAIIQKAAFHGAYVLSDEHYRYLPLNGSWPLETFAAPSENVIATGSITKCFGVIGLRMGWIVAPEKLIREICDFRDYLTHTLSPVSDYLAAIALENARSFIEPALKVLRQNAKSLVDMVKSTPGLSLVRPEGGIVAFPRFEYKISSAEFTLRLIKECDTFVLPGSSFETEQHFRINFGQNPELFDTALDRIHTYCSTLELP
ncbi:MAG: aminotransferase class I/II-fold pyridoxal phosphate-dependent enzyme [Candidatus Latescibacteria bacterium]|nr:aminotransferase class I/II-fold pyridoxal phosphate-dependent enzyme [Candidatus Latescibacterota bacterium]